MLDENRLMCIFCESGKTAINFTESNKQFLSERVRDGNIDEAITISRIAWDNFPILKESADTKKIVEMLLKGVQQTINQQILAPITTSISGLNVLTATLEKNPELIQKCSERTIQTLNENIKQIVAAINNGPTTVQIHQISEMLSQLIYKPNTKGSVGETILSEVWPQYFRQDIVDPLGGAGREDFLVTPYLNNGISRYGDRISIERKSGRQMYKGAHFREAVQHAIDKGASYAIIVYDTQENLPQKTMFAKEKGVLVAVVDLKSSMWKMAREIFEVLQKELSTSKKEIDEINVKTIQEVANDIGTIIECTSNIKGKATKIQDLSQKINEDAEEIKSAVKSCQNKLKSAIVGVEKQ
jgi:hypothetical protein